MNKPRMRIKMKVSSWEEALDQLVEEKQVLQQVLHNIVTEWEKVGNNTGSSRYDVLFGLMTQAKTALKEMK